MIRRDLIVYGGFYSVDEPGTRDDFGEIIEAAWFAPVFFGAMSNFNIR
ncbi:MAG: hypothetical protein L3J36_10000 [Rhodobacteraceae bacterium]|nr:hypothetical protein [Paracoccaceae bacterium]